MEIHKHELNMGQHLEIDTEELLNLSIDLKREQMLIKKMEKVIMIQ